MRLQKVTVAGAGLAGLCAARTLSNEGIDVTIVEARDRPGGRVWTIRDGLLDGQHAELGGEFIDAEQTAIRTLAGELGIELIRVLHSGFTHRFRCDATHWCVSRTRPWDELRSVFSPLLTTFKKAHEEPDSPAVRELSTMSVREWLERQDADFELHSMANLLRGFFLADPDRLSVLPLVEQLAKGGSPAQAEMYRVKGGNDRLIEALVAATPAKVLLQHRLRGISDTGNRIVAHVEDDRRYAQQIEADAMVVALPASTLRQVDIRPALLEPQHRAIRSLTYGCATKVVVQTAEDLFAGRRARAFATDTPLGAFWDAAEEQEGRSSIVTFLGGGAGSRSLRQRAESGARAMLSELCWLRPVARSSETASESGMWAATWEDDPWARGGYAYFDPGFDPILRKALSQRAGRLVFAGEHTSSDWQGYMNGAVESGVRAARELLAERR
jgi:monoamine oxidase